MSDKLLTAVEQREYARNFASSIKGNFVDGRWTPVSSEGLIDIFDPSTGARIGGVPDSNSADVDVAVVSARAAQPAWARLTPAARSRALLSLADLAEAHFEELAALEGVDAGKPITSVRDDELPGVIDSIRYFAGAARVLSAPAGLDYLEGVTSIMRREPVGVVAGITPWNYPILQAVAKIVPALATGNTVVIKPAETTPYSTALLVELAANVLPPGVLNIVFGSGPVAGDALSRHPDVDLVSFTGSVDTGRKVGAAAADGVKKTIMELGGNAPVLVFADANLDASLTAITGAGLYNCGQDCMAASRLIVHSSIVGPVVDGLGARVAEAVIGDALDPSTTMGPLNSATQLERVSAKVGNIPSHARISVGGKRRHHPGFYYEPTIILDVTQDDDIVSEEIFGPVFTIQAFNTEADAIEMANGTRYGLAASVFTTSLGTSTRVQNALEFGTVWVNNHLIFGPDLPVSGFGASGVGVENGELGILEFTRLKHIMVDPR